MPYMKSSSGKASDAAMKWTGIDESARYRKVAAVIAGRRVLSLPYWAKMVAPVAEPNTAEVISSRSAMLKATE